MKILKHGFFERHITCHCGCEFEYDKEDVNSIEQIVTYYGSKSIRGSKSISVYHVKCPECNEKFNVPDKIMEE